MNLEAYYYNPRQLAYAYGGPGGTAELKSDVSDFIVIEDLGFHPTGEGEHLWLWIEKALMNTGWLARHIADWAGVKRRDVGYGGLKDRHGITRQWFSVYLPKGGVPEASSLEERCRSGDEYAKVLEMTRHSKKLRPGSHHGNRFEIRLRNWQGDSEKLQQRLEQIRVRGVPNYFGEQRFGQHGDNVARFLEESPKQSGKRPSKGGEMLLSAARSFLFNRVLAKRVAEGIWDVPLAGDVMMLNGSRSVFSADSVDELLIKRCREKDVHVTGPLWGDGSLSTQADALALEQTVINEYPELVEALGNQNLAQERRSLRMLVNDLNLGEDGAEINVSFSLAGGGYATSVLRELVDWTRQP